MNHSTFKHEINRREALSLQMCYLVEKDFISFDLIWLVLYAVIENEFTTDIETFVVYY